MSACQQNRSLQKSRFLDPVDTGHVAVAVLIERRCKDGVPVTAWTRENCRHPRANRSLARYKFAFALDERDMADSDAGNVGDGIQWTSCARKGNSQFTSARPCLGSDCDSNYDGQ